ncbi:MAG: sigma-54-dependent Fis family transcriptional regulator [Nitrospinae bacterium]|nr:sigma-54-dependent Fis family transcriptional regulator [Nitrospinota bacterium]
MIDEFPKQECLAFEVKERTAFCSTPPALDAILVIDDDDLWRDAMMDLINGNNFSAIGACRAREGLGYLRSQNNISMVIHDLKLPDVKGFEALEAIKDINSDMPVVMLSAHGNAPSIVECMKRDAYDFIEKGGDLNNILAAVKRVIRERNLKNEIKSLEKAIDRSLVDIIGRSKSLEKIKRDAKQVAQTDLSVIIHGETGTGKTVLARKIHALSNRSNRPFLKVDIGTLTETLIESELFGHEKGAFTGAASRKKGFFEAANTGTLFIDEIENMSPLVQCKLLSVVEEKKFYPVGGSLPMNIDVRLIVATNQDLEKSVSEKKLRQDLYYRLNEYSIYMPPLRERADDIAFFTDKFIAEFCDDSKIPKKEITPEALKTLTAYSWPGNLRELKNVLRKAVFFSPAKFIDAKNISDFIAPDSGKDESPLGLPLSLKEAMKRHEMETIKKALRIAKGNKAKAASILEISCRGLYIKIKEYGIQ